MLKKENTYLTGKKQSSLLTSLLSSERIKKHTHFLGHRTVPKAFPYKVTSQTNSPGLTQRHLHTLA